MQDINDKDYIEAERLIEDCLRTGETSLKIKDLAIEGLPDAIGKLTHLKSLTIEYSPFNSNKKLETITQLVNLKRVIVNSCG